VLTTRIVLLGVVLPAILGGGLALLLRLHRGDDRGAWRAGLALGAGYLAGHVGTLGWPPFPAQPAEHWLAWLVPLALAAVVSETAPRTSPASRWVLRVAVFTAALFLLTGPLREHTWSTGATATWVPLLTLLSLVLWLGIHLGAKRVTGPAPWLALVVVAAGAGAALLLGGSQSLAQLAAGLAAAAGGAFVAALFGVGLPLSPPTALVPGTVLAGLLICGHFYAEVPRVVAVLLTASPLGASLVPTSWTEGRGPFATSLLTAAPVAIPVAAAVIAAWLLAPPFDPYY
jgi:hypothetical protein